LKIYPPTPRSESGMHVLLIYLSPTNVTELYGAEGTNKIQY